MSRTTTTSPLFRSAFTAGACTPEAVLAFHRAQFGSFRMEDDKKGEGDKPGDDTKDDADKDKGGDGGDESKLGDAGKRALQSERDARAAAERKANDVETKLNGLLDGLKGALGIETKEADASEVVAGLQKQLNDLQHQTLIDTVARRHGITEDDDIELLRSAKDKDVMEKLAARLKPASGEQDGGAQKKGGRPKPDSSQGKGGGGESARPSSVAQVMADRKAARDAAKK